MDLQRLGALLRERRANLQIRAAARQCRVSSRTYRLAEKGRRRPQIRTCYRFAGFLGLSPEEVMLLAGYRVPTTAPSSPDQDAQVTDS